MACIKKEGAIHILRHTNFGIFRYPPTSCHTLSQMQNYPLTIVWPIHIMNVNRIFFHFRKNVFITSFLASKWHQIELPVYFSTWSQISSKKGAELPIMNQSRLNFDIALQKQPTNPLSYFVTKSIGSSTLLVWCNMWMAPKLLFWQ